MARGGLSALYGSITDNDRLTREGIFQSGLGVAGAGVAKLFSSTHKPGSAKLYDTIPKIHRDLF